MSLILHLETATHVCSVALAENGNLVALREMSDEKSHATQLTVFVEEIFKEKTLKASDLSAIAVSKGPGSYTGLRIGVSAAKGIAYGAETPLIAISTLQSMAAGIRHEIPDNIAGQNTWLCPMIDARRMEVYSAFYDMQNRQKRSISADIIDKNSYKDILDHHKVIFFGNGAEKCKQTLTHPNAFFIDEITPSAQDMIEIAHKAFTEKRFENVAYFEPFYLKDFIATVPKKNIYT